MLLFELKPQPPVLLHTFGTDAGADVFYYHVETGRLIWPANGIVTYRSRN